MKYYLTYGIYPHYLDPKKKRSLKLNFTQYQLIQGVICHINYGGIYLRCLEKEDVDQNFMMIPLEDISEVIRQPLLHWAQITMKYYDGLEFRRIFFAFFVLNIPFFFGVQMLVALATNIPGWSF
jgi:hypothetical protein